MNPFKTPRKPRFVELARHRRRTMVRRLQTKIAANADEFGGRFTSHLAMSEPNRPPELDRWFDFKFLGLDRFTYWNACLITAGEAFWDAVHNLAYERASAALSPEDWMQEHRFPFVGRGRLARRRSGAARALAHDDPARGFRSVARERGVHRLQQRPGVRVKGRLALAGVGGAFLLGCANAWGLAAAFLCIGLVALGCAVATRHG